LTLRCRFARSIITIPVVASRADAARSRKPCPLCSQALPCYHRARRPSFSRSFRCKVRYMRRTYRLRAPSWCGDRGSPPPRRAATVKLLSSTPYGLYRIWTGMVSVNMPRRMVASRITAARCWNRPIEHHFRRPPEKARQSAPPCAAIDRDPGLMSFSTIPNSDRRSRSCARVTRTATTPLTSPGLPLRFSGKAVLRTAFTGASHLRLRRRSAGVGEARWVPVFITADYVYASACLERDTSAFGHRLWWSGWSAARHPPYLPDFSSFLLHRSFEGEIVRSPRRRR